MGASSGLVSTGKFLIFRSGVVACYTFYADEPRCDVNPVK